MKTLKELQDFFVLFRENRDWTKFHTPIQVSNSLVLEASEVMELFQWKSDITWDQIKSTPTLKQELEDELSDVLSYLLSFSSLAEIDLAKAFENKINKTASKYPIHKCKGSSEKYTKYQ